MITEFMTFAGFALALGALRERQGVAATGTDRRHRGRARERTGSVVSLPSPANDQPKRPRAPLVAKEAARLFALKLQDHGAGSYSHEQIVAAYAQWCQRCNRTPTPLNSLLEELGKMRALGICRVVESMKKDGKRHRPVRYFVGERPLAAYTKTQRRKAKTKKQRAA